MTKEVPAPRWVPAPHSDKRTYHDLSLHGKELLSIHQM